MLYDQAESVMAKLTEAYPSREVSMIAQPHEAGVDEPSKRYKVEVVVPPILDLGQAGVFGKIANDSRGEDGQPIDCLIDGRVDGGLTVSFE